MVNFFLSPWAEEYLYKQALAEQAAGNRKQAAALCERILTDYPMSMEASQAEKLLGGVN